MFLLLHDRPMYHRNGDHAIRRIKFLQHPFHQYDMILRQDQSKRIIRLEDFPKYHLLVRHFRGQPDLIQHQLDHRFLSIEMQNPETKNNNEMFIILTLRSRNDKELLLLFRCILDIGICSPFFNDFYHVSHLKTIWEMDVEYENIHNT